MIFNLTNTSQNIYIKEGEGREGEGNLKGKGRNAFPSFSFLSLLPLTSYLLPLTFYLLPLTSYLLPSPSASPSFDFLPHILKALIKSPTGGENRELYTPLDNSHPLQFYKGPEKYHAKMLRHTENIKEKKKRLPPPPQGPFFFIKS